MSIQLPKFELDGKSIKDINDYEQAGLGSLVKVLIDQEAKNHPRNASVKAEYPAEILRAPGLIGDIATYINATAIRKSPVLSLAGAIATVAQASGNNYVVDGWNTRLNVYIAMVGLTGAGKQHPQTVAKELAALAGFGDKTIEKVSSDAAIFRLLQGKRKVLLIMDEISEILAASKDSSKWEAGIMTALLQLYGLSGSIYAGKAYAKTEDNVEAIIGPFLNVLGATTPARFMDTVGSRFVHDGLLNRFLVFRTNELPKATKPGKSQPHPAMIAQLKAINSIVVTPDDPHAIPIEASAEAGLNAISERFDAHHRNDPELGAMWSRGFENTLKLAAIAALGNTDEPREAIITLACVEWAEALVLHSFGEMVTSIETESSESPDDKDRKTALKFIVNARNYKGDARWGPYCKRGEMPRSKLLKLTNLKKDRLSEAVSWLAETGSISIETSGDGVKEMTVYRQID